MSDRSLSDFGLGCRRSRPAFVFLWVGIADERVFPACQLSVTALGLSAAAELLRGWVVLSAAKVVALMLVPRMRSVIPHLLEISTLIALARV